MNSPAISDLRLFGSPSIAGEDGSLLTGRAAQRHPLALLALLALGDRAGARRDKLLALLWPESDTTHARQLLNQTVYSLRKALGEEVIISSGDELRFNPRAMGCDVLRFEQAVATDDLESAVRLYSGSLLDGFFLKAAHEFERWVDGERARLAREYASALEGLAGRAEARGDDARAVEWWKARAAQDPYDSRVACSLMRALDAGGNRAGALQHAALHQRLLEEEFGAEPDPQVLALARRLRDNPGVIPTPSHDRVSATPPTEAAGPVLEGALAPSPEPEPGQASAVARSPASARVRARWGLHRTPRIALAVVLLGIAVFGAGRWRAGGSAPSLGSAPDPSIAILPLANLSPDPRDSTLAAGMAEALTAILAENENLRVISRTSASAFVGTPMDVRRIADSLGVSHLLEGGVQKVGSRLRVQLRLIDARDGSTPWSETFDREMANVFAVQDDIARAVARELGVRLAADTSSAPRRPPTSSVVAYELFLRGTDRTLLRSDSAAREGLAFLQQAIALDSTYAAAWAALARMHNRIAIDLPSSDMQRHRALSESAARRAVALDDSLAEAHATLGLIRMTSFDFTAAEHHLTRAIELDPSSPVTHEWMVTLELWKERPAAALDHAEAALRLDPLSPYAHAEVARALLGNARCDEALAYLEELSALQPPLLRVASIAAQCYAQDRRWAEAIAVLRPQAEAGEPTALAQLGFMLARAGAREEALAVHAELLDRSRRSGGGAFEVAVVHAGMGDLEQAFLWLDRAITDGSLLGTPGNAVYLLVLGPLFEELRGDARFDLLRERLGLKA